MNGNTVISNESENSKSAMGFDILRPVFSILNPEFTYSVPESQTAAGTVDIMSHIFEQYFSREKRAYLQNRENKDIFAKIDMPQKLSEINITDKDFKTMAKKRLRYPGIIQAVNC